MGPVGGNAQLHVWNVCNTCFQLYATYHTSDRREQRSLFTRFGFFPDTALVNLGQVRRSGGEVVYLVLKVANASF